MFVGDTDRVAFAVPLRPESAADVEQLARAVTGDPSVVDLSRELGLQRVRAWIQEEELPILTIYMEWKVDPVTGLEGYEMSQEDVALQIQTVLRQAAASPEEAELDAAASRSEVIFEWGCEDGSRGRDVRCYARSVSREKAELARAFLSDLTEPLILKLYGRLRERVGMKCVQVWAEETAAGDFLLIELYESDDLDKSFAQLNKSAFELDEMNEVRTALTLGWGPGNMPELREIYDWGGTDLT